MLPGLVAYKPVAYKKKCIPIYQVETSRNFKISCPMSARFGYSTTKKLISQIKPCQTNSDHDRQTYVKLKSSWNSTIKETKKKNFYKNTLSSKHSIEVLKTVNKLLKMQKQTSYELTTLMTLISTLISCFMHSWFDTGFIGRAFQFNEKVTW